MTRHPEIKTSAADTLIITGDFNGELPPYDEELATTSQSVVGRWSTNSSESNTNGARLHEEAAQLKLCAASSQVALFEPFLQLDVFQLAWLFVFL